MAEKKPELVTSSTDSVTATAGEIDAALSTVPEGTKERVAFEQLVTSVDGALFGRCEFIAFREGWMRRHARLRKEATK